MKDASIQSPIGVMSVVHQGRKPFGMQTYYFEDMVKSVPHLQNEIFFFSPLQWESGTNSISGYKFIEQNWVDVKERIPDIIYDRSFSSSDDQKVKIEECRQFLSESGRKILNPFELANLLNNKVKFHSFLLRSGIPTLKTYPFEMLRNEDLFDDLGGTQWYIKPTFGSKGQGIYVIEKKDDRYTLYDGLGRSNIFTNYKALIKELKTMVGDVDYFIQEAANTAYYDYSPFDIRVLVQNYGDRYEVTGKAVRIGQKSSKTSNLNSGGNAIPFHEMDSFFKSNYSIDAQTLQRDIENLCLNCVERIRHSIGDFCEIGFDILITKDKGPIIIEGNAKPSRWVFMKIADYLENKGLDNSLYLKKRKETVSVPMKYASYLLRTES